MKPTIKDVDAILNNRNPKPEVKPAVKTWRDIPVSGDLRDWLEKDTFEHFHETLAEWQKAVRI